MAKLLKQIQCGRLVCAVAYTMPSGGDSPRVRAQKQKASTAARERLNARTSFQKLERTLAANFDDGDLYITLTFDDAHLPEDRDQTVKKIRRFLSRLRAARKTKGQPLRYIYVTEGCYPGYEDLASYLTKEPREWGHPQVGERTWVPSLGLARPEPKTERVSDNVTLTAPPDALVVSKEGPITNGYGEWCWIKYLLPHAPGARRAKARKRQRKKE